MRQRSDPFLPLLGSAVSIVVIAAIAVVFYPAAKRWFGADDVAVIGHPLSPSARVPVWIARADDGVALVLEATRDPDANRLLAPAFRGGPYRLLTLTVYNFDRETLVLDVPAEGLASPGGGPNALPAAAVVDLGKRGCGEFNFNGLVKLKTVNKPATKSRKGRNPFTGEEITIKAKPASRKVRARALRSLNAMI
jgi:hypothetical protein